MGDVFADAEGPKRSAEHAKMVRRNRELIAERTGWPEGALAECLAVEGENPGWRVWWATENRAAGFKSPAGFHAFHDDARDETGKRIEVRAFGATSAELAIAIRQA